MMARAPRDESGDTPELHAYGSHAVGVRTVDVRDQNRLDIRAATSGEVIPRYDRPLTLEVWYPATLEGGSESGATYTVTIRDGATQAKPIGRTVGDATPNESDYDEAPPLGRTGCWLRGPIANHNETIEIDNPIRNVPQSSLGKERVTRRQRACTNVHRVLRQKQAGPYRS